jgi:hypothetical protein
LSQANSSLSVMPCRTALDGRGTARGAPGLPGPIWVARWNSCTILNRAGLAAQTAGRPVVSQFELLIATFAAPHNLIGDVMPMIRCS